MKKTILLCILLKTLTVAQPIELHIEIPRDTSFTVYYTFIKERKKYPFIRIAAPQLPEGIIVEENIIYTSYDHRDLHLDIYYPNNSQDTQYPGIILVHGGGWRSGSRSHQIPMAQQLASKGLVTAPVEYRLSLEAKYPAAVYDLKAALRWMRANASKYRIDTSRIAILGCSAGGQLAALVGNTNGLDKFEGNRKISGVSSHVQAIIDIDGLLDFSSEESRKYEDDPKKNPTAAGAWFGGSFKEKSDLWIEASPIYYVNKNSPPILFLNSAHDRFHTGRDEMIEKLKSFNIDYDVQTIPDTPHPFWLFHPWFEPTVEIVSNFLDQVFKNN
ncbi:alpha/beta hydrolase fold domain-containing protein [bacterium]